MNYRIKFHITYVKYSESLIFHLKVPYIVYAWNGNEPLREVEDYKTFGITEEIPQGADYIDIYWNTIDDENYDTNSEGEKLDTISDPFFRLSTNFSLGIGPHSDDMPGPYTIKQLWKEGEKSFNFVLSGDTKIECIISLDEIGPKRLINSDYNLGTDPDHMTDLYNIIETDKQLTIRRELTDLYKIDNLYNNGPIEYISYLDKENQNYVFPSQMSFWNQWSFANGLQIKKDNTNVSFFTTEQPIPISYIPIYISDLHSPPMEWGRFSASTKDDKKYSFKIYWDNNILYIYKAQWLDYITEPSDSSYQLIQTDTNVPPNIILELQAAGGKGGDGNDNHNSYRPTESGAGGGGSGSFIRCLIDISKYTNSHPLKITLTPQKQNTLFNTDLSYSYIDLIEGQIRCYSGQPGQKQDGPDSSPSAREKWKISGGAGGTIWYYLNEETDKKYFVYATNNENPYYNQPWQSIIINSVDWIAGEASIYHIPTPNVSLTQHTYEIQNVWDNRYFYYYNTTGTADIWLKYAPEYDWTLLHAYKESPRDQYYIYYYAKMKPNLTTKILPDAGNILITTDLLIQVDCGDVYSADLTTIELSTSTDYTSGLNRLGDDKQCIFYGISNANIDDYNNEERNNFTCKILNQVLGTCGGNSPGHTNVEPGQTINETEFNWKKDYYKIPNNLYGNGGYESNGPRENQVTAGGTRYYYYGGAGGGGSALGYGQNGISIYTVPRKQKDEGYHTPTDGYEVDTNYWGGGGGGGCYTYYNDTHGNYVYGIDGQPAGFIIHW